MALFILALWLTACGGPNQGQIPVSLANTDLERGRQALVYYGCGSCHIIPGVPGADALAGPPLNHWSGRRYISGRLSNTPENLIAWIKDPQMIEPGTAMPDMNVTDQDARHIAAYLYSLTE